MQGGRGLLGTRGLMCRARHTVRPTPRPIRISKCLMSYGNRRTAGPRGCMAWREAVGARGRGGGLEDQGLVVRGWAVSGLAGAGLVVWGQWFGSRWFGARWGRARWWRPWWWGSVPWGGSAAGCRIAYGGRVAAECGGTAGGGRPPGGRARGGGAGQTPGDVGPSGGPRSRGLGVATGCGFTARGCVAAGRTVSAARWSVTRWRGSACHRPQPPGSAGQFGAGGAPGAVGPGGVGGVGPYAGGGRPPGVVPPDDGTQRYDDPQAPDVPPPPVDMYGAPTMAQSYEPPDRSRRRRPGARSRDWPGTTRMTGSNLRLPRRRHLHRHHPLRGRPKGRR